MKFRLLSRLMLPAILLTAAGCHRDSSPSCATVTTAAPAAEVATLQNYITQSGTSAVADSRGFYYVINNPGSGTAPTVCSTVKVNYTGKLTNGSQFDAGNGVDFALSGLITGWQEGIPLVAPGGRITLILPPSLAYGANAQNGIPANSILIFTIDLLAVE